MKIFLIILLFTSCNSIKKMERKENKAIDLVKSNNKISDKLKGYFFEKYPCVNDTVTNLIEGKEVIKYDTSVVYIDGEKVFLSDTFYLEKIKVKTIEKLVYKTDTFERSVIDTRMANLLKDSLSFYKQKSAILNDNYNLSQKEIVVLTKKSLKYKFLIWFPWVIFLSLIFTFKYLKNKVK